MRAYLGQTYALLRTLLPYLSSRSPIFSACSWLTVRLKCRPVKVKKGLSSLSLSSNSASASA